MKLTLILAALLISLQVVVATQTRRSSPDAPAQVEGAMRFSRPGFAQERDDAAATTLAPAAPDDSPTVILLVDCSLSSLTRTFAKTFTVQEGLRELAHVLADEFVTRLAPAAEIRLGGIACGPSGISAGTTVEKGGRDLLRSWFGRADVDGTAGPSPIWDTLDSALRIATRRRAAVIVLLTDGEATGNHLRFADVLRDAARIGVPIHVVSTAVDQAFSQTNDGTVLHSRPSEALRQLAAATGGLFLQAPGADREFVPRVPFQVDNLPRRVTAGVWDPDPGAALRQIVGRLQSVKLDGIERHP